MEDIFIKKITINKVRHIKDFEIPISETKKKHLIITGKNGSGKTSFLQQLKVFLYNILNGTYHALKNELEESFNIMDSDNILLNSDFDPYLYSEYTQQANVKKKIKQHDDDINKIKSKIAIPFERKMEIKKFLEQFDFLEIAISHISIYDKFVDGEFILAFFGAKRGFLYKEPSGPSNLKMQQNFQIEDKAGEDFIQYLVNSYVNKSFAREDNDIKEVEKIDSWFKQFEEKLFEIFEIKTGKLVFNRSTYNFYIHENDKEPYNLNQLSDGYSAILNIVTELIMRMEHHKTKNYDVQGIVLIDEIETHLHLELQKKVLPFLISFFPKIQFIVTTHSPFVITSVDNAVICDLEKRVVISDDFTKYTYEALVENYFDSDKYSNRLKMMLEDYEKLMNKYNLSIEEENRLKKLKGYFNEYPKIFSDELVLKLQQIQLNSKKVL